MQPLKATSTSASDPLEAKCCHDIYIPGESGGTSWGANENSTFNFCLIDTRKGK